MSRLCNVCARVNQKFWRYPRGSLTLELLTSPVEHKSLVELLDFERPGNRLRSVPNVSRLPAKAQGCRHALLSKPALVGIVKAQGVSGIFLLTVQRLMRRLNSRAAFLFLK